MIGLTQVGDGVFDLTMLPSAEADGDEAASRLAASLVYAALFTDQEAPSGVIGRFKRVESRLERGGWWHKPDSGSGLWHVRRQALSPAVRRETLTMVRQVLTAKLTGYDPAFSEVAVTEVSATQGGGNVSAVMFEVTGLHNGRKFLVRASL